MKKYLFSNRSVLKALSVILIITMFLSLYSFISNADDMSYEKLKNERDAYWDKYSQIDQVESKDTGIAFCTQTEFFDAVHETSFVLFYLDQAQGWTMVTDGRDNGCVVEQFSEVYDAAQEGCVSDVVGNAMYYAPILYNVIKKLDIPKKDLYTAREKMLTDPGSGSFPSDNARSLVLDIIEKGKKNDDIHMFCPEDFMIEALYLKDKKDAVDLLIQPYAIYTPQGVICPGRLLNYYLEPNDYTQISQFCIQKEDFDRMEAYVYSYCAQYKKADEYIKKAKQIDLWLSIIEEAKRILFTAPQAGEQTVLYILCSVGTGCALPAAALLARRKKRRV